MSFSFPHTERLKSRKTIEHLFRRGEGFMAYPLKVVWCKAESEVTVSPVQMAVSVPKRNFKRAADRNLLKRRIREAWRLHKHDLMPQQSHAVMFIYVAKEPLPYLEIEKGITKSIRQLAKLWSQTHPET